MMKRAVTVSMVLAILLAAFASLPAQKVLAGSYSETVLLIHGWNQDSSLNCNAGSEFGTIESYVYNHSYPKTLSLGFYNNDYNCDNYLLGENSHCTGWYDSGSSDGTVNEDIRHTSCLLAWFIWDHYTYYGQSVAIIAHSLGGIIIRQAMNDTPYETQFPNYLYVSDVVTAGTPHQGIVSVGAWLTVFSAHCASPCVEIEQIQDLDPMMINMNSTSFRGGFARNPQGDGGTDWTTMSSMNDPVMFVAGTINPEQMGCPYVCGIMAVGWMPGATHFIGYPGPYPSYDHGGYLTDTNVAWNADEMYSDNNGGTWASVTTSEHSIYSMYEAALLSSW